jgi:D-alanine transaminase/branched-chain amino acid aminotransferase
MEAPRFAWFNGSILPAASCHIPINDLGLTRGYAVFDFFQVTDGVPMFANEHIARLMNSAKAMHLQIAYSPADLMKAVHELIVANACRHTGIKLLITGGNSTDGYSLATPNVFIACTEASIRPWADRLAGIQAITWPFRKPFPHIKTTHYISGIWLKPLLAQQAADEVIYCDDLLVTECPRSNVFVITHREELITPSENILHGVTRNHVLQLSRHRFTTYERPIACTELEEAAEIFITSTTQKITPVVGLNGKPVGEGKCGPVTMHLMQLLTEFEAAFRASIPS